MTLETPQPKGDSVICYTVEFLYNNTAKNTGRQQRNANGTHFDIHDSSHYTVYDIPDFYTVPYLEFWDRVLSSMVVKFFFLLAIIHSF